MKISSSLTSQMLGAFKAAFGSSAIACYGGAVPTDANAAVVPGTLLGFFFQGGNNTIALGDPVKNTVGMRANESYLCDPQAAGTATYFRLFQWGSDDSAAAGPTGFPRVQGTIGKVNADLILADPVFVVGVRKELKYFSVTLPLTT
ncbi:MAG: hypothetical protein EOO78_28280 [Oxalobacteraceae bacterium]|nr:MAG: hypothetical protein EOO78_28280 [Oxalobacteraceae bacterium]